ncbi:MAG: GDSL-type esterase/lipase family protein [Methanocella sp.]|jgi:acyl-CoA thioesterase-1
MVNVRAKVIVAIGLVLIISVASFLVYQNIANSVASPPDLSRVACVGDSLTEISTYVRDLQNLLGNNSVVGNFGASGTTVTLSPIDPYLYRTQSDLAVAFQPTTVVILLGTNDARGDVFGYIDSFVEDYKVLISKYQSLESNPQIYLALPPPVYENNINISNSALSDVIIPKIQQVASDLGLPVIDVYSPMLGHPEYFVDGVHPNYEGASVIAETIYQQITS